MFRYDEPDCNTSYGGRLLPSEHFKFHNSIYSFNAKVSDLLRNLELLTCHFHVLFRFPAHKLLWNNLFQLFFALFDILLSCTSHKCNLLDIFLDLGHFASNEKCGRRLDFFFVWFVWRCRYYALLTGSPFLSQLLRRKFSFPAHAVGTSFVSDWISSFRFFLVLFYQCRRFPQGLLIQSSLTLTTLK